MSETLIKVEGVSKKFCKDLRRSLWYGVKDIGASLIGFPANSELRKGEFWAVKDVSFELKRGECLGLIGHNGAGKSTLLKMLNGLIRPDEGRIEMHGKIGALIELGAGFNPVLTGRENVYNNGAVLGFSKAEIERKFDDIVAFAELEEFIDMPVQNYSSGMKVRLGFAVAAQLEPDILILDEVLAVGDAAFRIKCFNRISEILKIAAVVFVSHSMQQITRVCNILLLLKNGKQLDKGDEIGRIIGRYHALCPIEVLKRNDNTKIANIISVDLQDKNRQSTRSINYGDQFRMTLNLLLNQEEINTNLELMVIFTDGEQNNVAQIFTPIEKGNCYGSKLCFEMEFEKMQFNGGKYLINIAILNGKRGEIVSSLYNSISFTVVNEFIGYAGILLKPTKTLLTSYEI